MVEDRGSLGQQTLQQMTDALVERGNRQPGLMGLFTLFRSNTPQLYVDIDRTKVKSLGVSISDVFNTLQVYMGSLYVNNFNAFGRSWQVDLQADGKFRNRVDDVGELKVRNLERPDGSHQHRGRHPRRPRPGDGDALPTVSGRADQRQHRPRHQLRPGRVVDGSPGRPRAGRDHALPSGPS